MIEINVLFLLKGIKKSIVEIGCIEECDNCKEKWEKTGCAIIRYGCCKQEEEKSGCQAFEKCTICRCDPFFKHDAIME
ncbi:hypothetical protein RclHR1_00340017 [Rhizophagus clarus]|uniref:Uncharacterized protein n=1 Tax=Rhizophagus clarus TaxID=94130 RepID=A0A2Z6S3Z9_9GLOM|nr:hypothetical protein RclHR1_00340017 [Rhizophagus clarus]